MSIEQIKESPIEKESNLDKNKTDPILKLIEEFIVKPDLSNEDKESINDQLVLLLEEFFEYRPLDAGLPEYKKQVLNADSYDEETDTVKKLVRSVNLSELIRAFNGDAKALSAGNVDDHYANSGKASWEATKIALSEGKTEGPCKTIISFKTDNLEVHPIEVRPEDPRDQKHRVENLTHVIGTIKPEDIDYVLLRFPMKTFPENLMSEEEIDINNNRLRDIKIKGKIPESEEGLYFVYRGINLATENKKLANLQEVSQQN
ncbi:MAG: hypothetical protein WC087_01660 [Candidatus Paceibacterota bacterium]